VQAHQPRGLRGYAVGRHQLLLLADRADEAKRVGAKADQPEQREQREAQPGGARHAQALALAGPVPARPEDQEWQRQPGGRLDRHPRDERGGAGAESRVRSGREQQRGAQRQQQQRVVVRAADGQLEQHRVQTHEGGGEARRAAFGNDRQTPRFPCRGR
jgi:hypothetical protein